MVRRDSVESNMKVTRRNQMSDQSGHVLAQPTLNLPESPSMTALKGTDTSALAWSLRTIF